MRNKDMSGFREAGLLALKAKIAALEAGGRGVSGVLPFGDARLDEAFIKGGLPLGQWHEFVSGGMEAETCAAPAAFAALMAAPLANRGEAVWILRRDDLFAPGLAGLGFPAEKLIEVCARDEAEALAVAEDALATEGVSAVFAEVEAVDLTAGRRLQLACEARAPRASSCAVAPMAGWIASPPARRPPPAGGSLRPPGQPEPGMLGLGAPRWEVHLERCRAGRPGAWLMEATAAYTCEAKHGTHPLRLVAPLGDRQLAPTTPLRTRRLGHFPPKWLPVRRRKWPHCKEAPFALIDSVRGVRVLTAVDLLASAAGLRLGQKATDAMALCPDLETGPPSRRRTSWP